MTWATKLQTFEASEQRRSQQNDFLVSRRENFWSGWLNGF